MRDKSLTIVAELLNCRQIPAHPSLFLLQADGYTLPCYNRLSALLPMPTIESMRTYDPRNGGSTGYGHKDWG